jgi:hypothetical protein
LPNPISALANHSILLQNNPITIISEFVQSCSLHIIEVNFP